MNGYRSPYYYNRNLEGYGFYDPMMKYPDFGQGMQQLIQNLAMIKQMKQEQEQQNLLRKQREYERERQQKLDELTRKNIESQIKTRETPQAEPDWMQKAKALVANNPNITIGQALNQVFKIDPEEPLEERIKRFEAEAEAKARGAGTGKFAPPPSTKTIAEIEAETAARARGAGTGRFAPPKPAVPPEEKIKAGATTRQANQKELRDFYKTAPDTGEVRNIIETTRGQIPLSSQGYRLDMPEKYNLAKLNVRDGVATPEDIKIIKNYDAMFKIFQDEIKDYPTFQKWISGSPSAQTKELERIDKNQMKKWYDIYGVKGKFLGIF